MDALPSQEARVRATLGSMGLSTARVHLVKGSRLRVCFYGIMCPGRRREGSAGRRM